MYICPLVEVISLVNILKVVDFPAPLTPNNPNTSPLYKVRFKLLTAKSRPILFWYTLETFFITTGKAAGFAC